MGKWSAPQERIVIQLAIIAALVTVAVCTTYLTAIHAFDKTTSGALLGSVSGSLGAALVHKMSTRSDDRASNTRGE